MVRRLGVALLWLALLFAIAGRPLRAQAAAGSGSSRSAICMAIMRRGSTSPAMPG